MSIGAAINGSNMVHPNGTPKTKNLKRGPAWMDIPDDHSLPNGVNGKLSNGRGADMLLKKKTKHMTTRQDTLAAQRAQLPIAAGK